MLYNIKARNENTNQYEYWVAKNGDVCMWELETSARFVGDKAGANKMIKHLKETYLYDIDDFQLVEIVEKPSYEELLVVAQNLYNTCLDKGLTGVSFIYKDVLERAGATQLH